MKKKLILFEKHIKKYYYVKLKTSLRHRQINNVIHFPKEFTEKKCNIGIYGNFGVGAEIVGLSETWWKLLSVFSIFRCLLKIQFFS
jgi:hypothetical protein